MSQYNDAYIYEATLKQHLKKLSSTKAELKKSVAYKKKRVVIYFVYERMFVFFSIFLLLPFYEAFSIPLKKKYGDRYTIKFHEQ